jgi:hypothetical protein
MAGWNGCRVSGLTCHHPASSLISGPPAWYLERTMKISVVNRYLIVIASLSLAVLGGAAYRIIAAGGG